MEKADLTVAGNDQAFSQAAIAVVTLILKYVLERKQAG